MKASTRRFAIKFNRARGVLERRGVRMFNALFRKQYKAFLDAALSMPPQMWTAAVGEVQEADTRKVFEKYYPMFAPLANANRKRLKDGKDEEDIIWENIFEENMTAYMNNTAGSKITSITGTTKEKLTGVVRNVLAQGEAEGLGIPQLERELRKQIGQNLKGNARARAKAIAQTEMISASNQAANEGAMATGLETRKFWSTSGLPNTRETHLADQRYSNQVNGLKQNETFPNTGLRFPGDPSGAPEEVINCRCTLLHEVV